MKEILTEGGRDWYTREIKKQLDFVPTKAQYSSIMRMYLDRVKIEDVVINLKKGETK